MKFGESVAGMVLVWLFIELVTGLDASGKVDWNKGINASGDRWCFWLWSKILDCVSSVLQDFFVLFPKFNNGGVSSLGSSRSLRLRGGIERWNRDVTEECKVVDIFCFHSVNNVEG